MLKYQELRRQVELQGQEKTASLLTEALQSKELKAEDFSIRALAEAFCGREWVDACRPGAGTLLTETSAVNTAAFANITGQIVYSAMLESYQNSAFIGDQLMPTVPTEFKSEKIPGVTRIGDMAEIVPEGEEYPYAGVSEDWIETAETKKRGFIIPITKEAIFFDRTGMVLQHARMLGQDFGINKEKRQLSVALGGTNTYKWKGTTCGQQCKNCYVACGANTLASCRRAEEGKAGDDLAFRAFTTHFGFRSSLDRENRLQRRSACIVGAWRQRGPAVPRKVGTTLVQTSPPNSRAAAIVRQSGALAVSQKSRCYSSNNTSRRIASRLYRSGSGLINPLNDARQ